MGVLVHQADQIAGGDQGKEQPECDAYPEHRKARSMMILHG